MVENYSVLKTRKEILLFVTTLMNLDGTMLNKKPDSQEQMLMWNPEKNKTRETPDNPPTHRNRRCNGVCQGRGGE